MTTKEREYKSFGRVLEIMKGNLLIRITLDVGPRIIYYGNKSYNIFYEDIGKKTSNTDIRLEKAYGNGAKWYLLGGHRLWKAPEDILSYTPDVKAEITQEGDIITIGHQDKVVGLKKEIELELIKDNKVKVLHRFTNISNTPQEVAIWGISVLRAQGRLIIPMNKNDKGFLPSRNFVYWSYSDYNDIRFSVDEDYAYLEHRKDMENAFKVGMYLESGTVGYQVDDVIFIKTFDVNPRARYTDYGCNFETYTNGDFLECESISGLKMLESAKSMEHIEVWDFEQAHEKDIHKILQSKL